MTAAIKVENLSKAYQIGQIGTGTISRDIERWFVTRVLKKEDPFLKLGEANDRTKRSQTNIVWSLKDISLEIGQGDSVGIIGRNGAGKSTLLKLLSRVTAPTTGSIKIRGRVASLLEVGTGFHPELTGRENIYLNGSIMGMRKREIDRKLDEIVDFSGVERYIDTPVKRYSSGMSVRLAFAVAAHLDSEILIVDEVLAVGDAEFQMKCLGKMGDVNSREGRTVLFVSHNMESVAALTEQAFLLHDGSIRSSADTSTIVAEYCKLSAPSDQPFYESCLSSTEKPTIERVELKTSHPNNVHSFGEELRVEFRINTPYALRGAALSFQVIDSKQRQILHVWLHDSERPILRKPGRHSISCVIPKSRLYMGDYTLTVHFAEVGKRIKHETLESVCPFTVKMINFQRNDYPWQPFTATFIDDFEWFSDM